MNNQVPLWLIVIVPWFTLFFMKRLELKWYLPVAMLTVITSLLIITTGSNMEWWVIRETVYPLGVPAEVLGVLPVAVMWIMKLTYRRFWAYLAADITLNLVYSFLYFGHAASRIGVLEYMTVTPWFVLILTTIQGLLLYLYQTWQGGVFVHPKKHEEKEPEKKEDASAAKTTD